MNCHLEKEERATVLHAYFLGIHDRSGAELSLLSSFLSLLLPGGKFFKCITALMLQIGAQQCQWRVTLACPGRSFLNNQVIVETVAFKDQRVSWTWGSSSNTTLRSSWRRRKGTVVMENSSVDVEPAGIDGEKLLVDKREVKRSSSFNTTINKASKWVVAAIVAVVVLWRRDEHTLWFAIGSILCGGLAKCLKYLINENRPPTADGVKGDPGMPSSHAQGFSYFAAYACLALLSWQGINIWTSLSSLGILVSFAYLSWLRVAEGLHTLPQVLVGSTVGSAVAAFWLYVWKTGVGATVDSSALAKLFLYLSFLASCVLCYFISFKDWQLGEY